MNPLFDDNNVPRCPVMVTDYDYTENPDGTSTFGPGEPYRCNSELWVEWRFMVPLDVCTVQEPDQVWSEAVSSAWEFHCEGGHVFATSSNGRTTYDSAEPFDPAVVLGGGEVSDGDE